MNQSCHSLENLTILSPLLWLQLLAWFPNSFRFYPSPTRNHLQRNPGFYELIPLKRGSVFRLSSVEDRNYPCSKSTLDCDSNFSVHWDSIVKVVKGTCCQQRLGWDQSHGKSLLGLLQPFHRFIWCGSSALSRPRHPGVNHNPPQCSPFVLHCRATVPVGCRNQFSCQ